MNRSATPIATAGRRSGMPAVWLLALLVASPAAAEPGPDDTTGPFESVSAAGRIGYLPDLAPPWTDLIVHAADLGGGARLGLGGGVGLNRVNGWTALGLQELSNQGWLPSLRTYQAYGLASHRWSGSAEGRVRPPGARLALGIRWFDETSPWPLPVQTVHAHENLLAVLLFREDLPDYLRRRGVTAFLDWSHRPGRGVVIAWSEEEHESLPRRVARPGLFGGDRRLRLNPPVEARRWRLARVRASFALVPIGEAREIPDTHALLVEAIGSGAATGGGPDFLRVWVEQRGRQRLAPSQFVGYRLAAGWAGGGGRWEEPETGRWSRLPTQWRFQAGGVGTLRGHRHQEFSGDRMLLATLEYGLLFANRQVRPLVFLDGGRAWDAAAHASGGVLGSGPLAIDGGVGVQLGASPGALRLDLARDLRAPRSPARVSARLGFPY